VMARGELLKKLFATYNRRDQFRAVAIQIIQEEEKKKNLILANSLRKTLEAASSRSNTEKTGNGAGSNSESLRLLPQERDKRAPLLLLSTPTRRRSELVLSRENERLLAGVVEEFRRGMPSGGMDWLCDRSFSSAVHLGAESRFAQRYSPERWAYHCSL
jgi:hypothetical protein